jgi:hypothetical protein
METAPRKGRALQIHRSSYSRCNIQLGLSSSPQQRSKGLTNPASWTQTSRLISPAARNHPAAAAPNPELDPAATSLPEATPACATSPPADPRTDHSSLDRRGRGPGPLPTVRPSDRQSTGLDHPPKPVGRAASSRGRTSSGTARRSFAASMASVLPFHSETTSCAAQHRQRYILPTSHEMPDVIGDFWAARRANRRSRQRLWALRCSLASGRPSRRRLGLSLPTRRR